MAGEGFAQISVTNGNFTAETCQSNGSATFTVSNINPSGFYKIIKGQGEIVRDWTLISHNTFTVGILAQGNYNLLIKDQNRTDANLFVHAFTILDNRNIVVTPAVENIKCIGDQFGRIRFTVPRISGGNNIRVRYRLGTGPFFNEQTIGLGGGFSNYIDNDATNSKDFPAGTYFFEVRQGSGNDSCILKFTIVIKKPDEELSATVIQELDVCPINHATVLPTGGWGGYTFQWSNGLTTQTASGLPPGTYWVRVTDKEGCTLQVNNIVIPNNNAIYFEDAIENPSCGQADGEIKIIKSNLDYDRHDITWRKNNSQMGEIIQGNEFGVSGLPEGRYFLILKEIVNGSCQEYVREYVLNYQGTPVTIENNNQEVCEGDPISFSPSIEVSSLSSTFHWYRDAAKNNPITTEEGVYRILPDGTLEIESLPYTGNLYEFFVEVQGDGVCESHPGKLAKATLTVKPKPIAPLINVNGGLLRL